MAAIISPLLRSVVVSGGLDCKGVAKCDFLCEIPCDTGKLKLLPPNLLRRLLVFDPSGNYRNKSNGSGLPVR